MSKTFAGRVHEEVNKIPVAMVVRTLFDGAFVVGGAVRDVVAGVAPKDVDMMVVGESEADIIHRLERQGIGVEVTGKDFPVIRAHLAGSTMEISLPRVERSTGPGHNDFEVMAHGEAVSLVEDLCRRDFTCNAMAVSRDGELIDPLGGVSDIDVGIIKSVGPTTMADDPLRTLRAYVLVSRFGWSLASGTKDEACKHAHKLYELPKDRIVHETIKIMEGKFPHLAIQDMHTHGVLAHYIPEFDLCWDWDQNNKHHQQALAQHMNSTLEVVCKITEDPFVRLAAVLHDIGKRVSGWRDPIHGSTHFYEKWIDDCVIGPVSIGHDHEDVGADMAEPIFERMGFSREQTDRMVRLVRGHMWGPFDSKKGARKFLSRYGQDADDLMLIRYGDQNGKVECPGNEGYDLHDQRCLVAQVRAANEPISVKMLAVDGRDAMAVLGIKPGPRVGLVLRILLEAVIEDPHKNTKDYLLAMMAANRAMYLGDE